MPNPKLKDWIVRLLVLTALTAGLWMARGSLPMAALSASAADTATIQGMIGKATHTQQKVESKLPELESTEEVDATSLEELEQMLESARKDLAVAYNLMNAHGATTDIQGWYYARSNAQSKLEQRVAVLRQKAGGS